VKQNSAGRYVASFGVQLAMRRLQTDMKVQGKADGIAQFGMAASGHHGAASYNIEKPATKQRKILRQNY
jgi:hypothetical protein